MLLCPEILQNYREQNSGQKCAQILLSKIFGPNYGHLDQSKLLIGFLKSYKVKMYFWKKKLQMNFKKLEYHGKCQSHNWFSVQYQSKYSRMC